MESKIGAASSGAALTLGATRERLTAAGYAPVSIHDPENKSPPWCTSEHPVAVSTLGGNPLGALVLTPPKDKELEQRVRDLLAKRGLTTGPVRIGGDGCEVYPIRHRGDFTYTALDGGVQLLCSVAIGLGQGIRGVLIPFDGSWPRGTLLEVLWTQLPELSGANAQPLFDELNMLPYAIRRAKEPPPKPTRRAFLGAR